MTIYTKKGDKGETGLLKKVGKSVRVSKSSCNTRAIGAVDEVNSYVGVIISETEDQELKQSLLLVQNNLLTIGSILAGSNLKISFKETSKLEKEIDKADKTLKPLTNFIYPGGSPVAAKLQYARTLARKAEREVVGLQEEESNSKTKLKKDMFNTLLPYLNRLSDYLFTLARRQNYKLGMEDRIWKK